MLLVEGSFKTRPFRHLSNHVFRSPYFRKYISYQGQLSFENSKICYGFQKRREKLAKNVFISETTASELVPLIVPVKKRILIIDSKCVIKQS